MSERHCRQFIGDRYAAGPSSGVISRKSSANSRLVARFAETGQAGFEEFTQLTTLLIPGRARLSFRADAP
jgi:hypothetical protein